MSNSYVTVTDQFCGAGGSSLGAQRAGAEIRMALNHWKLAIETHNTNFPNTDHDCTDISACDPRRYPHTEVLITSPECTNHSLAKGKGRPLYKQDLFGNVLINPEEERSRATMWDVCRFAEYHDYQLIFVENVVDARQWPLYDAWLLAMQLLGYEWKEVFYNSMFAHPTPQSRDRMYVVFWKKGNTAPDLDLRPSAFCLHCGKDVEARQTWKNGAKRYGRYGKRGQYMYCCPECQRDVDPYYYPALTAIDWSLPIQRIGDRHQPLKERTLARIRIGLERFKDQHLVMDILYSHAHGNRSHPVTDPWPTQTGQQSLALIRMPWLLGVNQTGANRQHGVDEPSVTQTASLQQALVMPFLAKLCDNSTVKGIYEPMDTQVASASQHALVMPQIVQLRNHQTTQEVTDPLGTVTAGGIHAGLLMPYLASYYGSDTLKAVNEAMGTLTGIDRHSLVMPTPFIASQYNGESRNAVHSVSEHMPTVPGMAVHSVVHPSEPTNIEDCGFRMLEPHEIGRAMAFPDDYVVLGNKRQKVKQYGNAVTPPVMALLLERGLATLAGAA